MCVCFVFNRDNKAQARSGINVPFYYSKSSLVEKHSIVLEAV